MKSTREQTDDAVDLKYFWLIIKAIVSMIISSYYLTIKNQFIREQLKKRKSIVTDSLKFRCSIQPSS